MKPTRTGQEQFSRNISNGITRFEKSGLPFVTGFLTPAEQNLALRLCSKVPHYLDGGRENALRARLIVGEYDPKDPNAPQSETGHDFYDQHDWQNYDYSLWQQDTNIADSEQTALLPEPESRYTRVLQSGYDHPTKVLAHSDVLGALMHAGLERDAIGDIAVDDHMIYVVCLPSVEEFIVTSISKIGNVSVHFERSDANGMPAMRFDRLKINTASMRADCIVSALAHCSRTMAKDMICQGFVKVNDEILETGKVLCNNDNISVRRVGKFRIGELDGVSRKGRLIVNIDQYQ